MIFCKIEKNFELVFLGIYLYCIIYPKSKIKMSQLLIEQNNKKKRKPRARALGNSERAIKFWHNFDKLFKMPNGEGNEPSDHGVEKPLYDLRAGYLSPSKDNNHIMVPHQGSEVPEYLYQFKDMTRHDALKKLDELKGWKYNARGKNRKQRESLSNTDSGKKKELQKNLKKYKKDYEAENDPELKQIKMSLVEKTKEKIANLEKKKVKFNQIVYAGGFTFPSNKKDPFYLSMVLYYSYFVKIGYTGDPLKREEYGWGEFKKTNTHNSFNSDFVVKNGGKYTIFSAFEIKDGEDGKNIESVIHRIFGEIGDKEKEWFVIPGGISTHKRLFEKECKEFAKNGKFYNREDISKLTMCL